MPHRGFAHQEALLRDPTFPVCPFGVSLFSRLPAIYASEKYAGGGNTHSPICFFLMQGIKICLIFLVWNAEYLVKDSAPFFMRL